MLEPTDQDWIRTHFSECVEDVVRVAARTAAGTPSVLTVRPLRHEPGGALSPCPTLYWLCDQDLKIAVSRLESVGWITALEAKLQANPAARATYYEDHARYARARRTVLDELWPGAASEPRLAPLKLDQSLHAVGIGGIRNKDAIKCLHLHLAHHLVDGSLIGAWVQDLLTQSAPRPPRP